MFLVLFDTLTENGSIGTFFSAPLSSGVLNFIRHNLNSNERPTFHQKLIDFLLKRLYIRKGDRSIFDYSLLKLVFPGLILGAATTSTTVPIPIIHQLYKTPSTTTTPI
jgi:hypothetical protein